MARLAQKERFWLAILTVLMLLGGVLLLVAGPPNQEQWGADIFVFMEGGWRVVQGQRPHLDFNTSLGFGVFVLFALLGVVIAFWCWAVARTRMRPWMAAVLAIVAGYHVFSPALLDYYFRPLTYAGCYTKLDHALLLILYADALAPGAGTRSRAADVLSGISTGLIVFFFAISKLTFVMPAFAAIAFSGYFHRRARVWWAGIGASLAVGLIATTIYLRGDPMAPIRDFLFVAEARSSRVGEESGLPVLLQMRRRVLAVGAGKVFEVLHLAGEHLALLGLSAGLVLTRRPLEQGEKLRLLAIVVLAFALPVVVMSWQWAEVPTIAFLGLLLADGAARTATSQPGDRTLALRAYAVSGIALVLCMAQFSKNGLSMLYAEASRRPLFRPPTAMALQGDSYGGFFVIDAGHCRPNEYAKRVNEGMEMLKAFPDKNTRIFAFDFVNPFSFGLQHRSPRGDSVSWSSRASFSRTAHLPAEQVFKEVDVILIPKCPLEPETTSEMMLLYEAYVQQRFGQVAESPNWTMLARRPPP